MAKLTDLLNRPLGRGKTPQRDATGSHVDSSTPEGKKKAKKAKNRPVTGTQTGLQDKSATAAKVLLYTVVALIAAGALAGMLAFLRPAPKAPKVQDPGATTAQQQAGSYASSFVASWLSATSEDHGAMDGYLKNAASGGDTLTGKTAMEYKDLSVASVKKVQDDLTTVVVSATVKTETGDKKHRKTTWTPSWYQVSVKGTGDRLAVTGYPAPVSMPSTADQPNNVYTKQVSAPEAAQTISDFMSAYATGTGDVTRYISPDSTIRPITPTFFSAAKVTGINAAEDIAAGKPDNGQQARVLVNATLTRDDVNKPVQYALTLKARDGRWEVVTIDPAPTLDAK